MNSGAEAVETAVKTARKWGYEKKGIPEDKAEIIACANNFHGRTTTVISFSTEPLYRKNFGPFTPASKSSLSGTPKPWKRRSPPIRRRFSWSRFRPRRNSHSARRISQKSPRNLHEADVLFIADEIQTGLGRTGKLFACEHEKVKADMIVIGKSLGGGCYPISACLGERR